MKTKDPTPMTTHRDYDIRYSVNEDKWRCGDLDLDADKLSTLKDKINRTLRDAAAMGRPAIQIGGYGTTGAEVLVTRVYWRTEQKLNRETMRYEYVPTLKVDVYGDDGGKKRLRKNRPIEEFAANTSATNTHLAEWSRLQAAALAASRAADTYLASIPRLTPSDIDLEPEDPQGATHKKT